MSLAALLLVSAALAMRMGLDAAGAWWVAALIASMPAIYEGTVGGFLDGMFAGFVLAAARIAFDAELPGNYALLGIFWGLGMATKYTGIVAWPILIFCSLVAAIWTYHRPLVASLGSMTIACGVAIAIASPFYLRNWILFGCPIYPPPPLLFHFFTPKPLAPAVIPALVEEVVSTGGGMGKGPLSFFLLPFHMTYHAANFRGGGGIGLVPLALGPFGVVARRFDPLRKRHLVVRCAGIGGLVCNCAGIEIRHRCVPDCGRVWGTRLAIYHSQTFVERASPFRSRCGDLRPIWNDYYHSI